MYHYGAGTNVGNVRDNNEDSYVCDEEKDLWMVADGMGGLGFGEVASAITTFTVARLIRQGHGVNQAIELAHKNIKEYAKSDAHGTNMGTTIVLLLSHGSLYNIFWVGDSRAYLYDAESLRQITVDHSLVQSLIEQGELTREEASTDPRKNAVTRALGVQELDTVRADSVSERWQPGQKIILCSDGLTDCVTDRDIELTIRAGGTDQEIVDRLIEAALQGGGKDNVTVIVVSAPHSAKVADTDTHVPGNLSRGDDTHVPSGDGTQENRRLVKSEMRTQLRGDGVSDTVTAGANTITTTITTTITPTIAATLAATTAANISREADDHTAEQLSLDIDEVAQSEARKTPDLFEGAHYFDPTSLTSPGHQVERSDNNIHIQHIQGKALHQVLANILISSKRLVNRILTVRLAKATRGYATQKPWLLAGIAATLVLTVGYAASQHNSEVPADNAAAELAASTESSGVPVYFSVTSDAVGTSNSVEPITRHFHEVEFPSGGEVLQVGLFNRLSGAEQLQDELTSLGLSPHIEKRRTQAVTSYALVIGPLDESLRQTTIATLDANGHRYFHRQQGGS